MKKGWEYKRIDEVCSIARGGSPRPIKDYITNDPDGLNWIKIGDTDMGGKYIYNTKEKIKPEGLKKSRWVEENEFLLSNSMSFGRPYILKTNGCIHDGWLVLRDYQEFLNIDFFYYVLTSDNVQKQFRTKAQGSTVSNLNTDRVASVTIPIPPLSEQQSIVDYLDSAFAKIDAMKANAEKALNEAKALFQASLKEMLEPREGWEEKKVKDVAEIKGGKRLPKGEKLQSEPTSHKYIRVADFNEHGTVDLSDIQYISDKVYEQIKRYIINKEDIYISIAGTIGKSGFVPVELDGANLTENACRLILSKEINQKFMYYTTISPEFIRQEIESTKISAQPKLALTRLADIIFAYPSIIEQHSIVTTLDSLKSKVDRLQANYEKISQECDALKQAILRQVFE